MEAVLGFLGQLGEQLSDFTPIVLLALLLLMILTIIMQLFSIVRQRKDIDAFDIDIGDRIEELGSELHNTMSEVLENFSNNIDSRIDARIGTGTKNMEKSLETLLGKKDGEDKDANVINAMEEKMGTMKEKMDALEEKLSALGVLLEKQGVYVHDQFSSMASSDEGVTRIRADLLQLINDQSSTLQETLNSTSRLLSDSVSNLSQGMESKMELLAEKVGLQVSSEFSGITDKVKSDFSDTLEDTLVRFVELQDRVNTLLDSTQKIDELGDDVASLSRVLLVKADALNNQQLADILITTLPEGAYELSAKLGRHTVSALIKIPGDNGNIAVDNNFDCAEQMRVLLDHEATSEKRVSARKQMGTALTKHINQVADQCIKPPRTGDLALLFVAAESTFAEIQAHQKEALALAVSKRVWMVSPTTLLTVLNMARNMIKDYQARERLNELQESLEGIFTEARAFEGRLVEISDHMTNAMRSVQRAETAGAHLFSHVRRVVNERNPNLEIKKDKS